MALTYFAVNVVLIVLFLAISYNGSAAMRCYTCSSRNGNNADCEDKTFKAHLLNCTTPTGSSNSSQTYCLKVTGRTAIRNDSLVFRECVHKVFGTTCGKFVYEGESIIGCMKTCKLDSCNVAPSSSSGVSLVLMLSMALIFWH